MEEKIKVNVSKGVNLILKKDMELFEFYKKDGTLNKNAFYNALIANYYQTFHENEIKRTTIIQQHLKTNTFLSDVEITNLSYDLANKLSEINFTLEKEPFDVALSIKPTKSTSIIYSHIAQYMLLGGTLSNFYRMLITSYTKLSQDSREKIIFNPIFETLAQAMNKSVKVFIKATKGNTAEIYPYKIVSSKEELFNYLLAESKNNTAITYRISKLADVSILNVKYNINENVKKILDKMHEVGPQYSIGKNEEEEIIVSLSEEGLNQFKTNYVNRPIPYKIENNLYYFKCSYNHIFQYFSKFGKNASVISPLKVSKKLYSYFKYSYFHYKQLLTNEMNK